VWGSVARGVRTPSRAEHDALVTLPPANIDPMDANRCLPDGSACVYPRVIGDDNFDSEEILAYQVGWRAQLFTKLFLDTVLFYHDFDQLLSAEPGALFPESDPPPDRLIAPLVIDNNVHGHSYGASVFAEAFVTAWWRLKASYTYLRINLEPAGHSLDTSQEIIDGSSPRHQAFLVSQLDLPGRFEIDGAIRYVDELPALSIREYVTFDVRLGYQVHPQLELSLVGQNLWDTDHREFPGGSEVERGGYAQARWRW
jgi:iron complex outermembrane receptor protein